MLSQRSILRRVKVEHITRTSFISLNAIPHQTLYNYCKTTIFDRVDWWRCRELNPGPTCKADTRTVMVLPLLCRRREEPRKGDKG